MEMINEKTIYEIIKVKTNLKLRFIDESLYDILIHTRTRSKEEAIVMIEKLVLDAKKYNLLLKIIESEIKECEKDMELLKIVPNDEAVLQEELEKSSHHSTFAKLFTIRKMKGLQWLMSL